MARGDGTITLATKIDTKGIESDAMKLANKFKVATHEVEKQTAKIEKLKQRLEELNSGNAALSDKSLIKQQAEYDKLLSKLDELKEKEKSLAAEQSNIFARKLTGNTNQMLEQYYAGSIGKVGGQYFGTEDAARLTQIKTELSAVRDEIEATEPQAEKMGAAFKKAVGAATQQEIVKTNNQLTEEEIKLGGLKVKAAEAGEKLKSGIKVTQTAASQTAAGFGKLGNKLLGMAKRVFVFSMITKALRSVRTAITDVLMSDDKLRNSINQLKAAFWVAFAPIYDFVIPALRSFIGYVTQAVVMLEKLFAKLSGKSFGAMVAHGKSLQQQTSQYKQLQSGGKTDEEKAIEKRIKAIEKENKALQKQKRTKEKAQKQQEKADKLALADFDEINQLTFDKDNNETEELDDKIEKNDDIIDQLQEQLDLIQEQKEAMQEANKLSSKDFDSLEKMDVSPISETMIELMKIAGAALVAIGLILMFTGHIVWGLGFIIAGAAIFGVAMQAEQQSDPTKTPQVQLAEFGEYLSGVLAVLGVILIFFGHIPLGIACVIAGIALFSVSRATLQENGVTTKIETFLQENAALIVGVSLALLVLGIILLFTPASLTLALGLIAAGAVGLVTEAILNWGYIKDTVGKFFEEHKEWIIGLSAALLVLGIILVLTGVNIPIGIAMIIGGIAGIVTEAVLNWNYIKDTFEQFFEEHKAWIIALSGMLLIMGIILIATGVNIPIGIAMIIGGIAGIVTEAVLNWNYIKDTFEKFFTEHKALIIGLSAALLVLGIILLFTGVGIPLGIALIVAGAAGIVTEAALNWDFLSDKVTEICGKVSEIFHKCIDGIKQAWEALPEGIKQALSALTSIIVSPFTAALNTIKSIVSLISKLVSSIGEKMSDTHVSSSGESHGGTGGSYNAYSLPDISYKVPALASGGVIPPNREFLAVLGDQKSGTNIEAPLDTIKQAVAEVVGSGTDNINIKFTGSLSQLARVLQPQIKRENRRVGTTLISE